MRRCLFVIVLVAVLTLPVLLGAGCLGGSSSASDSKSPFEQLQDRVTAVESKSNSNASNISSYVSQLRTDLDALSAQIVDLTDGADMAALAESLAELEVYVGELPEPEEDEELPTLVEILDDIDDILAVLEVRLAVVEDGVVGNSTLVADPLNITFLATVDGDDPGTQYLTVDIAMEPMAWVAAVTYPVDLPPKQWLFVSPAIGNQDTLVSVSASSADLPAGVYYAKITLLTASEVVEVSVTLMVSVL